MCVGVRARVCVGEAIEKTQIGSFSVNSAHLIVNGLILSLGTKRLDNLLLGICAFVCMRAYSRTHQ